MARRQSPQNDKTKALQRIGHLSVLPVFLNLRSKPVLVIGGGEPAAWKTELLAQAGASVRVIAAEICDDLASLAERDDLQGEVELHARHFDETDFSGMALVVADAEDDAEAGLIARTAARFGVPCNTIDRAEFCTFQFGSIVNRSPVVIGISTDGAAPVLGQSIRTKIETLLPQTLSHWADFAREIRPVVLNRFSAGAERRRFWAQFASLAFGPFLPAKAWLTASPDSGIRNRGALTTIAVNPDDPDELTIRSIRILRNADMIYFHPSISAEVLEHARREAGRSIAESCCVVETEIKDHIDHGRQIVFVAPIKIAPETNAEPVFVITAKTHATIAERRPDQSLPV
jgi:uroporphyrin-III C-methyltransferase/precorrin-2 dehydrogenase/sirohydrochlorin ferrochelatase